MKRILFFLVATMLVSITTGIIAQIPREFTYQGKLLGTDEQPVPEGHYKITFSLYNEQGTSLWSETHEQVFIGAGLFQVNLGSVNGMSIPFDEPYFLGIKIGEDQELEPRMLLTASPYSFRAEDANHVGGIRASMEPEPNVLFPLGNDGKFPASVLPASTPSGNYLKKGESDTSRGTSNNPMLLVSNLGNGDGINGRSVNGDGMSGSSENKNGTVGWTGASDQSGVFGFSVDGKGVLGRSDNNDGTVGWTGAGDKSGVFGHSQTGYGVVGRSGGNDGMLAVSTSGSSDHAAMHARNEGNGAAVLAEGDLVIKDGAYRGNIGPNGGAPFPRPAYDSGWVPISLDSVITLKHNLGGNPDNYVVDLQFRSPDPKIFINQRYRGHWWNLTYQSISVFRKLIAGDENGNPVQTRVRIWIYK
jgi:hypothetical protein